jgi:hypothetical protein
MAARAVLFAISDADLDELEARAGSEELIDYIVETIEARWEEEWLCELDKAWDAIHRALTDGSLDQGAGSFPQNAVVMGRESLDAGEDYFVGLTRAPDVPAVADAVASVTEDALRHGYGEIDAESYGPEYGPDDLGYVLGWFEGLVPFWRRAAEAGRSVIFTVDA